MHKESSMLYQCLVDAMVVKVDFLCQVERVNSFCHCEAQLRALICQPALAYLQGLSLGAKF